MNAAKNKRLLVKQVRSANGRAGRFHDTLRALGLGRIGKVREVTATPSIVGMLTRVETVLEVREIK